MDYTAYHTFVMTETTAYSDRYVDFQWKCIEVEGISNEPSPEDTLIYRENMRQLADSLFKLNELELACVMARYYNEDENSISNVRSYIKDHCGVECSKYRVLGLERSGLRKIRSRLRNVFGWER